MNFFQRVRILWRLTDIGDTKPVALTGLSESETAYNRELARLQLMTKFLSVADKAKEIETEWQRVQQDEHDAFFQFQVFKGTSQAEYAYKKGIADGIKWCVNRFS